MEPDVLQLVPVCPEYFTHKTIDEECKDQQFCAENVNIIFLNMEHLPEEMRDQSPRDVILMDKVKCHDLNNC